MKDDNFVSLEEMNTLQAQLDEITAEHPLFRPVISCAFLDKYKNNKTDKIPVPLFNEMFFSSGLKVSPKGEIMGNRAIMFTEFFKARQAEAAERILEPIGSIYNSSLDHIWKRSLNLRLMQEQIADKHYLYYLGWLYSLTGFARELKYIEQAV